MCRSQALAGEGGSTALVDLASASVVLVPRPTSSLLASVLPRNQEETTEMNEIEPGLYLGDVYDAKDIKELKKNNITHILCAAQEASVWHPKVVFVISYVIFVFSPANRPLISKEFTYLHLELDDEPSQDMLSRFPESIEFISQGIQQGGVLVHWYGFPVTPLINPPPTTPFPSLPSHPGYYLV